MKITGSAILAAGVVLLFGYLTSQWGRHPEKAQIQAALMKADAERERQMIVFIHERDRPFSELTGTHAIRLCQGLSTAMHQIDVSKCPADFQVGWRSLEEAIRKCGQVTAEESSPLGALKAMGEGVLNLLQWNPGAKPSGTTRIEGAIAEMTDRARDLELIAARYGVLDPERRRGNKVPPLSAIAVSERTLQIQSRSASAMYVECTISNQEKGGESTNFGRIEPNTVLELSFPSWNIEPGEHISVKVLNQPEYAVLKWVIPK